MKIKDFDIMQVFKFAAVGILNTFITYLVFIILIFFEINYAISLLIGYLLGIINSFIWNKQWVFQAGGNSLTQSLKFVTVYVFSYLVNLLILSLLISDGFLSKEIAELIALGIVSSLTFFLHKYWCFNEK